LFATKAGGGRGYLGFGLGFLRPGFLRFVWAEGAHRMIVRVSGLMDCKVLGFIFGGIRPGHRSMERNEGWSAQSNWRVKVGRALLASPVPKS